MKNPFETIVRKFEELSRPKPIEVRVPIGTWENVTSYFDDAARLPDSSDRAYYIAMTNRCLREAGLDLYLSAEFGQVESAIGPKPGYKKLLEEHPSDDGKFVTFTFQRQKSLARH